MSSSPDLAELFSQHMKQTSVDRRTQTEEFRAIIADLRSDVRSLGVMALLGLMALAGVQVITPTLSLTPPVAAQVPASVATPPVLPVGE